MFPVFTTFFFKSLAFPQRIWVSWFSAYNAYWLYKNVSITLYRQCSYHVEKTGSRPITELKQRRAWLVLGLVTAWGHHAILSPFFSFSLLVYYKSLQKQSHLIGYLSIRFVSVSVFRQCVLPRVCYRKKTHLISASWLMHPCNGSVGRRKHTTEHIIPQCQCHDIHCVTSGPEAVLDHTANVE